MKKSSFDQIAKQQKAYKVFKRLILHKILLNQAYLKVP